MKRNLFDELKEGFNALQSAREGKITLRQHVVEKKPAPSITPEELMIADHLASQAEPKNKM